MGSLVSGVLGGGGGGGLLGGLLGGGQQQPGYAPQAGLYSPQGGIPSMVLSGGNTPQQQGYGIAQPTWPMAYDTGPGLQSGTPMDIQNGNLAAAGATETQFADQANRYATPGAMGNWWAANQQKFAKPGMGEQFAASQMGRSTPSVSNNSQAAYQASLGAAPNVSANLDPYYENAKRRANEEISQQMAARGMASGTPGMDRAAEAMTDLNAEQANREAQYGLDYSADRRAWSGLQGQLAGQSDQSSLAGSNNQLNWMRGLGDLAMSGQNAQMNRLGQAGQMAGAADAADLARLGAGMNAAQAAQAAQQGRLGQIWDMQSGLGGAMANMANNAYGDMFGMDSQLMDSQMAMELGLGQEALAQSQYDQNRIKSDVDWAFDKLPLIGGMGGGGGMF